MASESTVEDTLRNWRQAIVDDIIDMRPCSLNDLKHQLLDYFEKVVELSWPLDFDPYADEDHGEEVEEEAEVTLRKWRLGHVENIIAMRRDWLEDFKPELIGYFEHVVELSWPFTELDKKTNRRKEQEED